MVSNRKCLWAFVVLAVVSSLASAQVVNVTPVPGNPFASGTALLNALAAVPATAARPFVLRLAPGNYNLGARPLVMRQWVDIEGSGQRSTVITGLGNNTGNLTAVVLGANLAELRNLRIDSRGGGFGFSIAILLNQVNTVIRDVTINSGNATSNWGIRNLNANSTIQDVTINVLGSTTGSLANTALGIANTGDVSATVPMIRRAVINVASAADGVGIYSDQNAFPYIRDVEILVSSRVAIGIEYDYSGDTSGVQLKVTNSRINVSGLTNVTGIVHSSNTRLTVSHTNITAPIGLRSFSSSATAVIQVDHCDVNGSTNSIVAPATVVQVGASKLAGPVNIGLGMCAASFNGAYVPLTANCL